MASTWTADELDRIGNADELDLAARRRDGSLRTPTTIWVVRPDHHTVNDPRQEQQWRS